MQAFKDAEAVVAKVEAEKKASDEEVGRLSADMARESGTLQPPAEGQPSVPNSVVTAAKSFSQLPEELRQKVGLGPELLQKLQDVATAVDRELAAEADEWRPPPEHRAPLLAGKNMHSIWIAQRRHSRVPSGPSPTTKMPVRR